MSEEQVQDQVDNTQVEATEEVSDIPEYIPSKFWNTETKEINVEDLGASYKALEKKLGMRTDELSKQIRSDIEAELSGKAPEQYEINPPELPDGVNLDIDPEMPLLQWWADTAKKRGLNDNDPPVIVSCIGGILVIATGTSDKANKDAANNKPCSLIKIEEASNAGALTWANLVTVAYRPIT